MGFARSLAVFASSFIVWMLIMVVSNGAFGGSVASIIKSLYGAVIFSSVSFSGFCTIFLWK